MRRLTRFGLSLAVAGLALIPLLQHRQQARAEARVTATLAAIVPAAAARRVDCAALAAGRPLVLLVLGQSNAGNHGTAGGAAAEAVSVFADGACLQASEPLPGATGAGGSIWSRLPALLRQQGETRPVVLAIAAVDASSIADWTRPDGVLRERLARLAAALDAAGLRPDRVLWQQGEADARAGTDAAAYAEGLDRLAGTLAAAGVDAPVLLARSTVCRSPPDAAVRDAIAARIAADGRFRAGPDTDTLAAPEFRHDGCHLSLAGLDRAARMWAERIVADTPGRNR